MSHGPVPQASPDDARQGSVKRWELERVILESKISDGSKIIGLTIVRHWSARHNMARLRLVTIAQEVGKSNRTVIRGVNELVDHQIFVRVRTGRASILRLGNAAKNHTLMTNSRSDILDTSEWTKRPPRPRTGTRFKEFCPVHESTEDDGERYVKDIEFYLGM